jgi:hypothetical protein
MTAEPDPRKPYPWRAVTFWLFVVVGLAGLGYFGRIWYQRFQAERGLNRVIAELDRDDPGWRLEDLQAAREVIPDAENGALLVLAVTARLPKDWPPSAIDEALINPAANEQLSDELYRAVGTELVALRATLEMARKLIAYDKGRYPHPPGHDPGDPLPPSVLTIRKTMRLLQLDALAAAEQRDFPRALRACRALIIVGRTIGDDPLYISLLVRFSGSAFACKTTERVLGQGTPALADLLDLQRLIEKEEAWDGFVQATRGERAFGHLMWQRFEGGEMKYEDFRGLTLSGKSEEINPTTEQIQRAHADWLRIMERYIEAAREPLPERGPIFRRIADEKDSLPPDDLLHSVFPVHTRIEEVDRLRHARLRTAAAILAAERYRLKNNRWPEKIDDLKEFAARETLIDPFDGKQLRLRREPDGLVIYSVGVNGIDDGGTPESLVANGLDVGYRLWDVDKRRQPPVPRPPPPEAPEP